MLPNMFKLLFGGTPGLASRSALGDVKLLIGLSGFDFRLLSAMMYCVEFCGAFGTAVFFAAGAALPPLFAGVFFFFAGGAAGGAPDGRPVHDAGAVPAARPLPSPDIPERDTEVKTASVL